ncbi:MAG: Activator of Hsp90 ATPase 1 family protein [Actinomycetia bacterium]|nr:Activator of Hsp90 ATPase 1 family protein [Actinomycetes bacterium]
MSVTNVHKDPEALTMTITAEFSAPVGRVWQLWADPRQLEQWWGPPTYPATVVDHDLEPGGMIKYFMTGPEGDRSRGWWRVLAVDPPNRLEFEDGFADDAGNPNPDMPTMNIRVTLDEQSDGGTRMAIETTFPSVETMEQMVTMGMEEGMTSAVSQIDDLLGTDARA